MGGGGGQGRVLHRPSHTGPDWIIRNELANVTNVTSISRACVTEAAWHWDDMRRILKHISVLWPRSDQTHRRVSAPSPATAGTRVWRNVWDRGQGIIGSPETGQVIRGSQHVWQIEIIGVFTIWYTVCNTNHLIIFMLTEFLCEDSNMSWSPLCCEMCFFFVLTWFVQKSHNLHLNLGFILCFDALWSMRFGLVPA